MAQTTVGFTVPAKIISYMIKQLIPRHAAKIKPDRCNVALSFSMMVCAVWKQQNSPR